MKVLHLKKLFLPLFILSVFLLSASVAPDLPNGNMSWWKQMKALESSTVVLNNATAVLPVRDLDDRRIASVNLGSVYASVFDSILRKYTGISSFSYAGYPESSNLNELNSQLKLNKTVIAQVTEASLAESRVLNFLSDINKSRQLIVVLFGRQQALRFLDKLNCPVVLSPEYNPVAANFTAQLIFGGVETSGRLTQNVSAKYKRGDGYSTATIRLKYTVPEELGINSADLELPIASIMNEAISRHATPGASIFVVKDGKVIFGRGYGSHRYNPAEPTKPDDIFDLASVTKISATTIAAMRLYEQQKFNLDTTLGAYLPLARNTSKSDLKIRELLLHEGGLVPYIPFFEQLRPGDFSRDSSELYSVKVADGYYLRHGYYQDVMLPGMLNSRLQQRGKYEYSDLSMYFIKEAIERQAMEKLDQYVLDQFYRPLGMQTAGFNPRNRFQLSRIVPTELDDYFRKTLIDGYVHDQGASMAGGVAGHAGLFASGNDLAILFQMLLNGGSYGGKKYFAPETINLFTSRQSVSSRRGLGFDRWDPQTRSYPSSLASPQTYGHTGFTGTCVWVDPKYKLIYIFLSNRVYDQTANKLNSMKIRPRIQDAIYQAIGRASG